MNTTESSKCELCKSLWLSNEPKLRKLCTYKLNGHPDEIEDILAETAFVFWKNIIDGNTIESPAAWLYKVTGNLIKKKYRELNISKERKVDFNEENLKLYNFNVGYDFENSILTEESVEKFCIEIEDRLSDDEKQLYKYVYEEKLKMKEIAVRVSSTESAVKQKNYRLTRKIRQLVKEYLENY